jgi:hypothetical protein
MCRQCHPAYGNLTAPCAGQEVYSESVTPPVTNRPPSPPPQNNSSGRVVKRPEGKHNCFPFGHGAAVLGQHYTVLATPSEYPEGTVWVCAVCDKSYVSLGEKYANSPGHLHWRREGRVERWLRERTK